MSAQPKQRVDVLRSRVAYCSEVFSIAIARPKEVFVCVVFVCLHTKLEKKTLKRPEIETYGWEVMYGDVK